MLRTLIVDDEPPARKRLRKLLQPFLEAHRLDLLGEAGDGVEALALLRAHQADLLFLDIQMPELDGFDVLERLEAERRPIVVFTTAYDAYALKAFEANAVDYLLKPIAASRLEEAISRAERLSQTPVQRKVDTDRINRLLDWMDQQAGASSSPAAEAQEYLRQLSIPYRDRILVIPVAQLVSAEINEGITRLHVLEEAPGAPGPRLRQHIVNYTLDQLEANLDPDHFLRVHRSALVQLDHIQELIPWFSGRYKLMMAGKHEVIASRERAKQLKERLMI